MADPTPTLDATIGGPNANSYVTLAQANAYFDNSPYSQDWKNHSDAFKEAALIQATQYLDALAWAGSCCASTQRLQWPRKGITCRCKEAVCTEIPNDIETATCELAFQLAHDPDAITGNVKGNGATGPIKEQQLGDLKQSFYEPPSGPSGSKYPPTAPLVLQTYPWLGDLIGSCWLTGSYGSSRILARVRS